MLIASTAVAIAAMRRYLIQSRIPGAKRGGVLPGEDATRNASRQTNEPLKFFPPSRYSSASYEPGISQWDGYEGSRARITLARGELMFGTKEAIRAKRVRDFKPRFTSVRVETNPDRALEIGAHNVWNHPQVLG